jgi:hypothetical protein
MPHLEEQFTIICIDKRVTQDGLGAITVKCRIVKEDRICRLQLVHGVSSACGASENAVMAMIRRMK